MDNVIVVVVIVVVVVDVDVVRNAVAAWTAGAEHCVAQRVRSLIKQLALLSLCATPRCGRPWLWSAGLHKVGSTMLQDLHETCARVSCTLGIREAADGPNTAAPNDLGHPTVTPVTRPISPRVFQLPASERGCWILKAVILLLVGLAQRWLYNGSAWKILIQ
jgi:hypothetical protein